MADETGPVAAAEAVWDALDAAHDNARHVHAAECCWSFPGAIDAIAATLAGLLADPAATEPEEQHTHVSTSWDGMWDKCKTCGQRFIPGNAEPDG